MRNSRAAEKAEKQDQNTTNSELQFLSICHGSFKSVGSALILSTVAQVWRQCSNVESLVDP